MKQAVIVPFPLARRKRFILRQARQAASMKPEAGERYILSQIQCQADAMFRKGIDETLIRRECVYMEAAVRTALWQVVMQSPGGAA